MSELLQAHPVHQLFLRSFRVYRKYWLPIMTMTLLLLLPAFLAGQAGARPLELLLLMLNLRLIEAAMMLGLLVTCFHPWFPSVALLQLFGRRFLLASLHVLLWQYLAVAFCMHLTVILPRPLNVLGLTLALIVNFVISLSQAILIAENQRGYQALVRCWTLARPQLLKLFGVVMINVLLQVLVLDGLIQLNPPRSQLAELEEALSSSSNQEAISSSSRRSSSETTPTEEIPKAPHSPPAKPPIDLEQKMLEIYLEIRWAFYLMLLIVHPFIAIVLGLLYFDLRRLQGPLPVPLYRAVVAPLLPVSQEAEASPPVSSFKDEI